MRAQFFCQSTPSKSRCIYCAGCGNNQGRAVGSDKSGVVPLPECNCYADPHVWFFPQRCWTIADAEWDNYILKMQYNKLKKENETIRSKLADTKTKYDWLAQRKTAYKREWAKNLRELDAEMRQNDEMHQIIIDEQATSDHLRHCLEELEQHRSSLSEHLFSNPLIYKKHALIAALDCFHTAIIAPYISARFRRIHEDILKNSECDWLVEIKKRTKMRGKHAAVEQEQCDVEKVSRDSCQFAIMFLNADIRTKYKGFQSLDLYASLSLMISCQGVIPNSLEKHAVAIRNLRNLLSHACLDEELERVNIGSIKMSMQKLCQHAQACAVPQFPPRRDGDGADPGGQATRAQSRQLEQPRDVPRADQRHAPAPAPAPARSPQRTCPRCRKPGHSENACISKHDVDGNTFERQDAETYARRKEQARREAAFARTQKVQAASSATEEFELEGQEAAYQFETTKLHEAFAILDSVKGDQPQEYYHCCAILPCSDSENSISDFMSDEALED
jgi:hypothetical protein